MTNQNKHSKTVKTLLPIVIGMAILAVAAVVYVMNGANGNPSIASNETTHTNQSCDLAGETAIQVGNAAQGDVAAMIALDTPRAMPTHQFVGPDGSQMSTESFKGKVLLVNLWATWCAPCREEMPALSELQAARSGDNFEVLTINIDRGDRVKPMNFLNEVGISNLPLYQDNTMDTFNAAKKEGLALGLPVTMLLDSQGCILASMNGPAHWSGQDALNFIDAAIASQKTNETS